MPLPISFGARARWPMKLGCSLRRVSMPIVAPSSEASRWGAVAAVFLFGGGFAWLLVRLGVRTRLEVGSTLGLPCALALTSLLRGALNVEGGVRLGSYVLGSALAFRPLVRWLSPRAARSCASAVRSATSAACLRSSTSSSWCCSLPSRAAPGCSLARP
jgi:hypothetical protein